MPIRRCLLLALGAVMAVPAAAKDTPHAAAAPRAAASATPAAPRPAPTAAVRAPRAAAPVAQPRAIAHGTVRATTPRRAVASAAIVRPATIAASNGTTTVTANVGVGLVPTPAYAPAAGWYTAWHSQPSYDWAAWRAAHREVFHPGYYQPPGGTYAYAPLAVGALLAAEFWREQYWIVDPALYHLPPVSDPYRWVRYYNDCLLINIDTGEVVDVVQGVFW